MDLNIDEALEEIETTETQTMVLCAQPWELNKSKRRQTGAQQLPQTGGRCSRGKEASKKNHVVTEHFLLHTDCMKPEIVEEETRWKRQ